MDDPGTILPSTRYLAQHSKVLFKPVPPFVFLSTHASTTCTSTLLSFFPSRHVISCMNISLPPSSHHTSMPTSTCACLPDLTQVPVHFPVSQEHSRGSHDVRGSVPSIPQAQRPSAGIEAWYTVSPRVPWVQRTGNKGDTGLPLGAPTCVL